ncbi:MAG: hypothetical protein C5B50_27820 [Verrucomicrobia bacterium]|nr:MAG: hypothetical protein C5B50_27820 [Verrucomicrobiota bacterium]
MVPKRKTCVTSKPVCCPAPAWYVCLGLVLVANLCKATVMFWDPQGTNGPNPYIFDLSGNWEDYSWSTSGNGTNSPLPWIEGAAACFGVGTGNGTPAFSVYMATNHTVAGMFVGSPAANACQVAITGPGVCTVPTPLQGFSVQNGIDGSYAYLELDAGLTGPGTPTFEGNGQILLNGTNTHTGGTQIGYSGSAFTGTLTLDNSYVFGTGPITINNVGGSTCYIGLNAPIVITNKVIFNSSTNAQITFEGSVIFSGPWSLSSSQPLYLGSVGDLVTISGVISGTGGLYISSSGTVQIQAPNTYNGPTEVVNGILQQGTSNAVPSGSGKGAFFVYSTFDLGGFNCTVNGLGGYGTVDNTIGAGTYTFTVGAGNAGNTFQGSITNSSGTVALTKTGSGTITLSGANSYAGPTTISTGTLQIGSGSTTGTLGTGLVTNNATLSFNRSDTVIVPNLISGNTSGVLNQLGTGTLILSNSNTYSGVSRIAAGTLRLVAVNNLPDTPVKVLGGATFDLNNFSPTYASLMGGGALSNANGTFTLNGSLTTAGVNTAYSCFWGTVLGPANLVKDGTHCMALRGTNLFSGGTANILNGTLSVGASPNCLATNAAVSISSGAALQLDANSQSVASLSGAGNVNLGGGTLTVNQSSNTTFAGTIQNSALAGSSTASGNGLRGHYYDNEDFTNLKAVRDDATVNFPSLTVTNDLTGLPNAGIATNTFSIRWLGQVQSTTAGTYVFGTTCDDGSRLWVNGTLVVDNWTDQSAVAKYGQITLAGNTLYDIVMEYYQNGGGASAVLNWSPPGSGATNVIPSSNLFLPGPGNLVKAGAGTLVLSGLNTYTGPTMVSAGTLELAGTNSGTALVTVASGATLKLDSSNTLSSQVSLVLNPGTPALNLNYSGPATIGSLSFDGGITFVANGTWGPPGSSAQYTNSLLSGAGLLRVLKANCPVSASAPVFPTSLPDLRLSKAGTINTMFLQADGQIIVGGSFTAINDLPLANLARIDRFGIVDSTWMPNPDGPVTSLVSTGSALYVAGTFANIGGQARNGLALLSTTNSGIADPLWNPAPSGSVYAMVLSGTNLFAGGNFSAIGASAQSFLAKLDAANSGAADASWNAAPNGEVDALAASGGNIYAGGQFTSIAGAARYRLARLSTQSPATAGPWNPGVNTNAGTCCQAAHSVSHIVLSPTDLFFSGSFTNVGGSARHNLAKVSLSSGSVDASWNPITNAAPATFSAMAISGASLFVAGSFNSIGGQNLTNLASISTNSTGAANATFAPQINFPGGTPTIGALVPEGSWLFVGGNFVGVNGVTSLGIGKVDQATAIADENFYAQILTPGIVYALVRQPDGRVIVGGDFWMTATAPRWGLARVNLDGSMDPFWAPDVVGAIRALALSGTNLYAGGDFIPDFDNAARGLVKVDTSISDGIDTNFVPPICCGSVSALAVDGAKLYVGGQFTLSNQTVALTRVDPFSGLPDAGWNVTNSPAGLAALLVTNGYIFAGGSFTNIGGQAISALARFSTSGGGAVDTSWNENLTSFSGTPSVSALAAYSSNLFVGGTFDLIGGQVRRGLAKANSSSGAVDSTWDPIGANSIGTNGFANVYSLATDSTNLYAGANFAFVTFTNTLQGAAKINGCDGTIDLAWHPNPQPKWPIVAQPAQTPHVLAILHTGSEYIGGDYQAIGGDVSGSGAVARDGFAFLATPGAPVFVLNNSTNFQILANPSDGAQVGGFLITGITNGTLYLSDGVTQLQVGDFISAAQGLNGLIFSGTNGSVSVVSDLNPFQVGTSTNTLSLSATPTPVFSFSSATYTTNENAGAVTLTIIKQGTNSGTVAIGYGTADGSALAGTNYTSTFGTLNFSSTNTSKTISISLLDDALFNGNKTFTVSLGPSNGAAIAYPAVATVRLLESSPFGPGGSSTSSVPPAAQPAAGAVLIVTTLPPQANGQWRLAGQRDWTPSDGAVSNLITGNYRVEFMPLPGWVEPDNMIVPITAGITTHVTNSYTISTAQGTGALGVSVYPTNLAQGTNLATVGQWRVVGGATNWQNSGQLISITPGDYLVEFKPLSALTTPLQTFVVVPPIPGYLAGASVDFFFGPSPIYLLSSESNGVPPAPVSFTNASTSAPYEFVGQIATDRGFGSGVVVRDRVVLTAASVIFDDVSLSYMSGVRWFFQRYNGKFEPPGQDVLGACVLSGYASQRQIDNDPGVPSIQSQNQDVAALFLLQSVGRGGYSGWLASDDPGTNWVNGSRLKFLAGYPMEVVTQSVQGLLQATPITNTALSHVSGNVFATSAIHGYQGMSGGPLFVQADDLNYYVAAVYLGPSQPGSPLPVSTNASFLTIGSNAVDVIYRADFMSHPIGTPLFPPGGVGHGLWTAPVAGAIDCVWMSGPGANATCCDTFQLTININNSPPFTGYWYLQTLCGSCINNNNGADCSASTCFCANSYILPNLKGPLCSSPPAITSKCNNGWCEAGPFCSGYSAVVNVTYTPPVSPSVVATIPIRVRFACVPGYAVPPYVPIQIPKPPQGSSCQSPPVTPPSVTYLPTTGPCIPAPLLQLDRATGLTLSQNFPQQPPITPTQPPLVPNCPNPVSPGVFYDIQYRSDFRLGDQVPQSWLPYTDASGLPVIVPAGQDGSVNIPITVLPINPSVNARFFRAAWDPCTAFTSYAVGSSDGSKCGSAGQGTSPTVIIYLPAPLPANALITSITMGSITVPYNPCAPSQQPPHSSSVVVVTFPIPPNFSPKGVAQDVVVNYNDCNGTHPGSSRVQKAFTVN